jgi:hypothetical protein
VPYCGYKRPTYQCKFETIIHTSEL